MICSQSTTLSQVEGFDNNGNFDMDGRIKSRIHKVTVIGALLSFCFLPHKDIDVAVIAIFQHAKSRIIYCNQIVWLTSYLWFSDIHRHGGLCLGNYFFFVLLYSSWHENMSTATSFHINLTDLKSYWTSKMYYLSPKLSISANF